MGLLLIFYFILFTEVSFYEKVSFIFTYKRSNIFTISFAKQSIGSSQYFHFHLILYLKPSKTAS